MASFVMLGRRLTGVDWQPLAIELQHAPLGDGRELDALLAEPVRYRAERNALSLSNATLALPIAGARADRHALFVAHADSLMQERVRCGDVSGRVSALLASELPHGLGRQKEVAQRLGMSSRTLSRRLKQEGTTFGELLDETRRELSPCYLRDASLAVYEVAFLLGYSEPSTFFRAFKRWTGETPQSWRGACA